MRARSSGGSLPARKDAPNGTSNGCRRTCRQAQRQDSVEGPTTAASASSSWTQHGRPSRRRLTPIRGRVPLLWRQTRRGLQSPSLMQSRDGSLRGPVQSCWSWMGSCARLTRPPGVLIASTTARAWTLTSRLPTWAEESTRMWRTQVFSQRTKTLVGAPSLRSRCSRKHPWSARQLTRIAPRTGKAMAPIVQAPLVASPTVWQSRSRSMLSRSSVTAAAAASPGSLRLWIGS
mmetsp:Transcript_2113/g.6365  ORF Transcript_2113/g.6365 Transcript_2113/m.6365 type:complete len:232 (-) Transcript_2113:929-1624(-)